MDSIKQETLEEPEQKDSTLKRIIIVIIGVFLIFLILSFTFLRYPIGEILQGQAESKSIIDNKLVLKEFTIIFENNTENVLSAVYNNEQETKLVETSVCLKGIKLEKDYIINSIYYPKIHEQTFMHVEFSSCPIDTLIMLHTHPYKHCLASNTDLNTLNKAQKSNSDVIMIVMCEQERYNIYV
jgi:hypothetical protein